MEKQIITVKDVSFSMMPVEGGNFTMGASSAMDSEAWDNEKPPHTVSLNDYYIGETVVTQALWQAVMGGKNVSMGEMPVVWKSWKECQSFINKLNFSTGKKFRLPTEAEWENAAKGGNLSQGFKFSGSDNLEEVAWFDRNSGGRIHPVKQKKPNELGIYDMSGNVWEWCFDYYGDYGSSSQKNPTGPSKGTMRVCRGSSFKYYERSCRVTCRMGFNLTGADFSSIGFRLVLDAEGDTQRVNEQQQQKKPIQQSTQPEIVPAPKAENNPDQQITPRPKKSKATADRTSDEDPKYYFVKRPKGSDKKKKKNVILIVCGLAVLALLGYWWYSGKSASQPSDKEAVPMADNTKKEYDNDKAELDYLDGFSSDDIWDYDSLAQGYTSSVLRKECAKRAFDLIDSTSRESISNYQMLFDFEEACSFHDECDKYLEKISKEEIMEQQDVK